MSTIKDEILRWWRTPAAWWQFWLPQSGFIGGLLFGALITQLLIGATS